MSFNIKNTQNLTESIKKRFLNDPVIRARIINNTVNKAIPRVGSLSRPVNPIIKKTSNLFRRLKRGVSAGVNKYKELGKK